MLQEELILKVNELEVAIEYLEKQIRLDDKLAKTKRQYKAKDRELIAETIADNHKRIKDYQHLFSLSDGDLVTTLLKDKIGRIIGNCGHRSPFFVWVTWGHYQTLISSHVSSLIKLEITDTEWQWDGNRYYRSFDGNSCEDLKFLFSVISKGKISQIVWAKSQYNLLVQKMFSVGDEVIYKGKYYSITVIASDENNVSCFICSNGKNTYQSLYPHEVLINYVVF